MNQQLFENGLKAFQQAAELDPQLTIARLNQGIAFLNLQKVDDAKASLEDALKQDPRNPNAWYNLGLLAKNTGDAQTAMHAFKRVTDIAPGNAAMRIFLGAAYVQAKQFPQAIDAFQHALKLNPLHASAEFGLSRAYQQSTDVDHAREHLKKFQYITQNKIGAPMSLAYGEQGQYSRAMESLAAVLKPPGQVKVRFVDVTREAGLATKGTPGTAADIASFLGPGACFLDFDSDGNIDIFLPDNGAQGGLSLYHNLGNGRFEEVTKKAGLDPARHAIGCTAGDYDNDGASDLVVSWSAGVMLLHNEKNGTFKDTTEAAGIAKPKTKTDIVHTGLAFVDYDHDGDLDLYAASSLNTPAPRAGQSLELPIDDVPSSNEMWRNNGDSTFTNVTASLGFGLIASGASFGAVGSDYNNDRAVDLVVTDQGPTIFENPREGKV